MAEEIRPADLYFLITHLLEGGPCREAVEVLKRELEEHGLFGRQYTCAWRGDWVPRSYEQMRQRNGEHPHTYLATVLNRLHAFYHNTQNSDVSARASLFVPNAVPSVEQCMRAAQSEPLPIIHDAVAATEATPPLAQRTRRARRQVAASDVAPVENKVTRVPQQPPVEEHSLFHAVTSAHHQRRRRPRLSIPHVRQVQEMGGTVASPCLSDPRILAKKYRKAASIRGHRAEVYCIAFDRTGRLLFTGSDDWNIKVWNVQSGILVAVLRGHQGEITDLSVDPENRFLASGATDGDVRIWRIVEEGSVKECDVEDCGTAPSDDGETLNDRMNKEELAETSGNPGEEGTSSTEHGAVSPGSMQSRAVAPTSEGMIGKEDAVVESNAMDVERPSSPRTPTHSSMASIQVGSPETPDTPQTPATRLKPRKKEDSDEEFMPMDVEGAMSADDERHLSRCNGEGEGEIDAQWVGNALADGDSALTSADAPAEAAQEPLSVQERASTRCMGGNFSGENVCVLRMGRNTSITCVEFSPSPWQRHLAVCTDKCVVSLYAYDDFTLEPVAEQPEGRGRCTTIDNFTWSTCGNEFYTAGDHVLNAWRVEVPDRDSALQQLYREVVITAQITCPQCEGLSITSVRPNRSNDALCVGYQRGVCMLYRRQVDGSWFPLPLLPNADDGNRITHTQWSSDGRFVAIAEEKNFQISTWDGLTGERLAVLRQHNHFVYNIVPHPLTPRIMASCGYDGKVVFFDCVTGKPISDFSAGRVADASFSPDGSILAVSDLQGEFQIFSCVGTALISHAPRSQFFPSESTPLAFDANLLAIHEHSQTLPHLMPREPLCDITGIVIEPEPPVPLMTVPEMGRGAMESLLHELREMERGTPICVNQTLDLDLWRRSMRASRLRAEVSYAAGVSSDDDVAWDSDVSYEARQSRSTRATRRVHVSDDEHEEEDNDDMEEETSDSEIEIPPEIQPQRRSTRVRRAPSHFIAVEDQAAESRDRPRRRSMRDEDELSSYLQSQARTDPEEARLLRQQRAERRAMTRQIARQENEEPQEEWNDSPYPDWLVLDHAVPNCYVPQEGDEVVYIKQAHVIYLEHYFGDDETVLPIATPTAYCVVRDVSYYRRRALPDGACRIELEIVRQVANPDNPRGVRRAAAMNTITSTLTFHPSDDADFLVPRHRFDDSIGKSYLNVRIEMYFPPAWYRGTVVQQQPRDPDHPLSPWETLRVRWDGSAEETFVSPWEVCVNVDGAESNDFQRIMFSTSPDRIPPDVKSRVLDAIRIWSDREEAEEHEFCVPIDWNIFRDYFSKVCAPIDLDMMRRRLENDYYRTIAALKGDINLVAENAARYHVRGSKWIGIAAHIRDVLLRVVDGEAGDIASEPRPIPDPVSEDDSMQEEAGTRRRRDRRSHALNSRPSSGGRASRRRRADTPSPPPTLEFESDRPRRAARDRQPRWSEVMSQLDESVERPRAARSRARSSTSTARSASRRSNSQRRRSTSRDRNRVPTAVRSSTRERRSSRPMRRAARSTFDFDSSETEEHEAAEPSGVSEEDASDESRTSRPRREAAWRGKDENGFPSPEESAAEEEENSDEDFVSRARIGSKRSLTRRQPARRKKQKYYE